MISTRGITPETRLFHNEPIEVYPKEVTLSDIHFWAENNRTLVTFEELVEKSHVPLGEIPLDKIVRFVASRDVHKLERLSKSIELNGVRNPLIILDDGTLLDGNRRFFACHLVRQRYERLHKPLPSALKKIPAWIIKKENLTQREELKIIAEVNFVEDLKEPWPLDARAKAVSDYYKMCIERNMSHSEAISEIVDVFSITKTRAEDYLDTLKLTDEFVLLHKTGQLKRKQILERSFVYFWEFRNKATKGASAITPASAFQDVKGVFFRFMDKSGIFSNLKQIEPFIRAHQDDELWRMIIESKGTDLDLVVSIVNERKALRRASDKIRLFTAWLSDAAIEDELSLARLKELLVLCQKIIKRRDN